MASTTYYTILTKVGQAKIANAIAYGRQLQITQFALGDGNGTGYEPDENQTALKHEVYRANVSNVIVSDENINMLEINMAVPADQGGWVVREMGIYDAEGDLIAISKTPDDPKPGAGSGAAKDVVYRLFIVVANTDAVEIKIDPTVAVATKAEVQAAKEQLQEQIDALSQTLNSEIATLAGVVNGIQHYNTFADIDPAYTNDTLFATIYTAMVENSILRTQVNANATDYPASGLLEVIKQDASHGACTLSAGDGIYTLTITPENTEQIFGGGALNKWSKAAREADLTALSSEMTGVSDKIGDATDTAADAPTSLFAGIKRILQWFGNTWTEVRAAKVDLIDTSVKEVSDSVNDMASKITSMSTVQNEINQLYTTGDILISKTLPVVENKIKGTLGSFSRIRFCKAKSNNTIPTNILEVRASVKITNSASVTDSFNVYYRAWFYVGKTTLLYSNDIATVHEMGAGTSSSFTATLIFYVPNNITLNDASIEFEAFTDKNALQFDQATVSVSILNTLAIKN